MFEFMSPKIKTLLRNSCMQDSRYFLHVILVVVSLRVYTICEADVRGMNKTCEADVRGMNKACEA